MGKKLTIDVAVVEDDSFIFANEGHINTKCPFCDATIIFRLKGLLGKQHISPTIGWAEEWEADIEG